jgi:hypothetical protein
MPKPTQEQDAYGAGVARPAVRQPGVRRAGRDRPAPTRRVGLSPHLEAGRGGDRRRWPSVDGADDLAAVDALQVDAGDAEVCVLARAGAESRPAERPRAPSRPRGHAAADVARTDASLQLRRPRDAAACARPKLPSGGPRSHRGSRTAARRSGARGETRAMGQADPRPSGPSRPPAACRPMYLRELCCGRSSIRRVGGDRACWGDIFRRF